VNSGFADRRLILLATSPHSHLKAVDFIRNLVFASQALLFYVKTPNDASGDWYLDSIRYILS
jgi:hypothetical protein